MEVEVYIGLWEKAYDRAVQYYNYVPGASLPTAEEWELAPMPWKNGWMTGLRVCKELKESGGV